MQTNKREAQAPPAWAPWHLWPIGILGLLWNALAALQYAMAQTRNRTYLATAAEDMGIAPNALLAYVDSFPPWVYAAWALGVFAGIAGSALLLFRRERAVLAFALSLLGLVITQVYHSVTPQPDWAQQAPGLTMALWGIAIALLAYAHWLRRRELLR
ncbi:hypothetical protein [Qipengyuania sediminis]|uniref:hypothetical protein n=1 Tax=Qipengyuania sediminis TaxID=1532023 RepID=UPI0010594699|nr:hypothetical protein [Qipengyuania sediminis]